MARVPSTIAALKKLAKEKPGLGDIIFLADYLKKVEDRAAAIIANTQVEDALEDAIASKLVPLNATEYSDLFTGAQPLASFGAKTKFAFALGIIGKQTRSELDTIRWIRNAFAHSRKPLWFDTKEVAAACERLTLPERTPR